MALTKAARRAIILMRGWFPGCYALCRNAVSMGQKKSHRGNPVGFFIPSRAFFCLFPGAMKRIFRGSLLPPQGSKPGFKHRFFRTGDKPKIVN